MPVRPALRRTHYAFTAIVALGLFAAACGGDDGESETPQPSPTAAVAATSTATEAATATAAATTTATASPAATTQATASPSPTATAAAASSAPTATQAPTATPSPSPTPAPTASPSPSPTATAAATQAAAAEPEQRATNIADIAFEARIEVAVGSTITWTNQDGVVHTVTATDRSIDSGTFPQGQTYSLTFNSSGTFAYFCTVHPFMQGTVVVGDGEGTTAPTSAALGSGGGTTLASNASEDAYGY
ncbi:MAG: cupredoxin family copper-binding protein [Dehalococcoidia bacterium]